MKKIFLPALLVVLLGWLVFLYVRWNQANKEAMNKKISTVDNFNSVYNYLEKNYKNNYPKPEWDLILLNKKWEMIHLEDRKIPLNKVKDLYAIQWTTCDILKDNKEFNKINYDARYSIIKDWKVLAKKCFSYSTTKDWKKFQIWTIENWKAFIKWDSKKDIIKAYDAPVLVKNDSDEFLPYAPEKISPLFQVNNLWKSELTVKVIDDEDNENVFGLVEWNNVILNNWVNWTYQISLNWNIDKNTKLKFIDTDGSIVYISWNDKGDVNFQLKDYRIDTNRVDYIVETWKFLADIVRLSPEKNMSVSKWWTTLVIRWTKFSIDSEGEEISTYLVLWKILQKIKNWEEITLDLANAFSSVFGDKIKNAADKMKSLISFVVYNDIVNYPKYDFNANKLDSLTDVLSWAKVVIRYENWQNIWLLILDTSELNDILKENQTINGIESCNWKSWCIKLKQYKNLVNNICSKTEFKKWLDLSKLYYLLDNDWFTTSKDNLVLKFKVKDRIKDAVWTDDFVLYTSRMWWANVKWLNTNTRVWLTNKWTIDNITFATSRWIKTKKMIFACWE